MNLQIKPHEKEIIGHHFLYKGKMVADDFCARVEELIENYLEFICKDASGWDVLYRDPIDGRYWERIYLQSELHGGGPASLRIVNGQRLKETFGVNE